MTVVIVTATGSLDVVRCCLRSLREHGPSLHSYQITVVDNASVDGTPAMIRREFPEVDLVELGHNPGFGAANNVGIRRSGSPYLLLLNPDTELTAHALDHLLSGLPTRPQVGIAGCRLARHDDTFDHNAKRAFPTPLGGLAHFTGLGRLRLPALAQYTAPKIDELGVGEVDAVSGSFMLLRRAAVDDAGLFDEGYWMYGEDLDLCYRVKSHGWTVWYDGTVTIVHVGGGTSLDPTGSRNHRPLKLNLAFHRAMGRFYRKHYAGRRPLLDFLVYLAIGAKLTISVTRSAVAGRSFRGLRCFSAEPRAK